MNLRRALWWFVALAATPFVPMLSERRVDELLRRAGR